jgi:hypothetical protein
MKYTFRRSLRTILSCSAAITLLVAGCLGGFLEVGPIRFTANVGEGTILQDLFLPKGAPSISYREDLCDIPSESDLESKFMQVGGVDVSNFIRLSGLELVETKITATSGNFNFLSSMTVRYIPAPVNGRAQDPVVLGTATNQNGLGTEISLVPPVPVDFLDLIRENDDNPSSECPKLEVEMTPRAIPLQDVEYTADVTVDAYAQVGAF